VALFCLVVDFSPQILGDDKTSVLMHFGVKKLKLFDQIGLTWFMIWTAVYFLNSKGVDFLSSCHKPQTVSLTKIKIEKLFNDIYLQLKRKNVYQCVKLKHFRAFKIIAENNTHHKQHIYLFFC